MLTNMNCLRLERHVIGCLWGGRGGDRDSRRVEAQKSGGPAEGWETRDCALFLNSPAQHFSLLVPFWTSCLGMVGGVYSFRGRKRACLKVATNIQRRGRQTVTFWTGEGQDRKKFRAVVERVVLGRAVLGGFAVRKKGGVGSRRGGERNGGWGRAVPGEKQGEQYFLWRTKKSEEKHQLKSRCALQGRPRLNVGERQRIQVGRVSVNLCSTDLEPG